MVGVYKRGKKVSLAMRGAAEGRRAMMKKWACARFVLTIVIGLTATSSTLAHKGHGQDGEASGLYHYLTSHGLGVLLLIIILVAFLAVFRVLRRSRDAQQPAGVN